MSWTLPQGRCTWTVIAGKPPITDDRKMLWVASLAAALVLPSARTAYKILDAQTAAAAASEERLAERMTEVINWAYRGKCERDERAWTTERHLISGIRTTIPDVQKMLQAASDEQGSRTLFIAVNATSDGADLADACVGTVQVERVSAEAAEIGLFSVDPDLQGGGIGGALIAAAERHAADVMGCSMAVLYVLTTRSTLLAWYSRLGYVATSEFAPFPTGANVGTPRPGVQLEFVRLEKTLAASPTLSLPCGPDAMVDQAAAAVRRAFAESGVNHQVVQLPLSEAIYGDREEGFVADRAIGWQGGPQETYRFLQPLATDLLKRVDAQAVGLPPRVKEQSLLDFDGSSLLTAESAAGPLADVQAIVQPNADRYYLNTIQQVEEQFSDLPGKDPRLLLLVNPAWRDRSSWGFFDGAAAQAQVLDRYETTYTLSQFVVRGEKLSLLRAWPHPWHVFLTVLGEEATVEESRVVDVRIDGAGQARLLGTFESRPEYKQLDELVLGQQQARAAAAARER